MTIAATIAFILIGFMLFCIAVRLWFLLYDVMVEGNVHDYDGRMFFDEDDRIEVETTLEDMGTHYTPIEILNPIERCES